VFFFAFTVSLILSYALPPARTSAILPTATSVELAGRCELILFDTRLQPVNTVVLACPRKDMIRLWPFPGQQPWFEDKDLCPKRFREFEEL